MRRVWGGVEIAIIAFGSDGGIAHCAAGNCRCLVARQRVGRVALGQDRGQRSNRRAQIVAVHHHVDHAMLIEIFRALEALGQLLANGLLDHARAGKADAGAGFGNMHIARTVSCDWPPFPGR